jgi:hypothetical protein
MGILYAPADPRWGICNLMKTKSQMPVKMPGGISGLGIDRAINRPNLDTLT